MNDLYAQISTLTQNEKLQFIQHLKKKNRRGDTKNVQLFKLIDSGAHKNLPEKLYGKPNKNAYHALSKRLQDCLIDFIASNSFAGETSQELDILKLLLASRIFFEQKQYKIAFKTLQKAETLALQLDVYSILIEIYHTKIQYAHLNPKNNLEEVIKASISNLKHFNAEQQLNMVYARIKEQLQNIKNVSIQTIIQDEFTKFDIEITKALTYKSLYQLMSLTAAEANLQSDYYSISPFLIGLFEVLQKKEKLAQKHVYYHLEILNIMAYTSFRNKDFLASEKYTSLLEKHLTKKYANQFSEKIIILKALNANYTNKPLEAINLLESYTKESYDIQLILAVCLFQQKKHSESYQVLKALSHSDTWYGKKKGVLWVLKKNIIELLIFIELDKLDLVISRLQSFKKRYVPQLKKMNEQRVINFIGLVSTYYKNPKQVTSAAFFELVETSLDWKENKEEEDIFIMSFYAWLKAKMDQKDIYEVTLELVNTD